jgi:phospholipid:diacylglycerol acyltransferase
MSAFLSGEMKDTVQMNPAGAYGACRFLCSCRDVLTVCPVLERFFSRKERKKLFRSWGGSASMWIKANILLAR